MGGWEERGKRRGTRGEGRGRREERDINAQSRPRSSQMSFIRSFIHSFILSFVSRRPPSLPACTHQDIPLKRFTTRNSRHLPNPNSNAKCKCKLYSMDDARFLHFWFIQRPSNQSHHRPLHKVTRVLHDKDNTSLHHSFSTISATPFNSFSRRAHRWEVTFWTTFELIHPRPASFQSKRIPFLFSQINSWRFLDCQPFYDLCCMERSEMRGF